MCLVINFENTGTKEIGLKFVHIIYLSTTLYLYQIKTIHVLEIVELTLAR